MILPSLVRLSGYRKTLVKAGFDVSFYGCIQDRHWSHTSDKKPFTTAHGLRMRLINVHTQQLEDFTHREPKPYAILSHTWGDDEVTFQALLDRQPEDQDPKWAKITQTCRLAREEGLDYAWVDTCCIDKSSSAELTESINSMYRWYEAARLCFVYLSDLTNGSDFASGLGKCRWSTRGWTLQEILAPKNVRFYDARWKFCGSKDEHAASIAEHLQLPRQVLVNTTSAADYSVAQRMSWAARRITTRAEDIAYCLLGIFDVSMPLIYGEGAKAFRRLQQAIIEQSNDLTILAWKRMPMHGSNGVRRGPELGLLAPSPRHFATSASVKPSRGEFPEFSVTNKGLLIRGDLSLRVVKHGEGERYTFRLGWRGSSKSAPDYRIGLRRIGPNMFCRDHWLDEADRPKDYGFFYLEEFYILEELPTSTAVRSLLVPYRHRSIHVPRTMDGFRLADTRPRRPWDCQDGIFLRPKSNYGSGFPNILAILLEGTSCASGKHFASCIVLCDYRMGEPQLFIFNRGQNPRLMTLVFGDSTRQSSLHWEDLQRQMPELKGHGASARVRIHNRDVELSAELRLDKLAVTGDSDSVDVFSLGLRVVGDKNSQSPPCNLTTEQRPPGPQLFVSRNI